MSNKDMRCAPYTIFGKTLNVPVRIWYKHETISPHETWEVEHWHEREEDLYGIDPNKKTRVVYREDWLEASEADEQRLCQEWETKERKLFFVDTITTTHCLYCVEARTEKEAVCIVKNKTPDEYASNFVGENILLCKETTKEQFIDRFDEYNDLPYKGWSEERKLQCIIRQK